MNVNILENQQQDLFIQRSSMLNGINFFGKILRKIGLDPFQLDSNKIILKAKEKANYTPSIPPNIQEGLEVLVQSINKESQLNPFGALALKGLFERTLQQRLQIEKAFSKVKTLSGLLTICAACKKIRDDEGYWNQIEAYLSKHTDTKFSHGLCEECAEKLYGDQEWYKKRV